MEVTRKALIVLLAGITVGPFPAYSIEPESEFQRGYVERMSDWICEDPDYIQCLGISNSKCNASIYSAFLRCDITNFEALVHGEDLEAMKAASIDYANCISDNFVSIAKINQRQWEVCQHKDITPMPNNSPKQDAQ